MKIIIAGATGFIGTHLTKRLVAEGHELLCLTRPTPQVRKALPAPIVTYDPWQSEQWWHLLEGCDAVINLAGRPIADRWNPQVKQEILESRQLTTQTLVSAIERLEHKPKLLINGSAIGYYGTDLHKVMDENSPPGQDFLAAVCQAWEMAADRAKDWGVRVVKVRTGVVLGKGGGALARILPIFRVGLGGKIGSGAQWFSWIHLDDLVSVILFALYNDRVAGVLNGTAPAPLKNTEFTEILAKTIGLPALFPVPAFAIQLAFGEGAVVVLEGQQVIPKKLQELGFAFRYPDLQSALQQIVT